MTTETDEKPKEIPNTLWRNLERAAWIIAACLTCYYFEIIPAIASQMATYLSITLDIHLLFMFSLFLDF
jgi:hypothetical protein